MNSETGTALISEPQSTRSADCAPVLDVLFARWPEAPGDALSPAFLQHLCHCRDCLRSWIALEAAFDLAGDPIDVAHEAGPRKRPPR